ncbi:MAG: phosphodiester glycosidase family protein [Flavobacteriia bacterium]|nr:phosphodiester glycosidase family protein [Flavobacteriia bacterium]
MLLRKSYLIFVFSIVIIPLYHCQNETKDTIKPNVVYTSDWTKLSDGLFYCERDAPIKSKINDSKISIVKFDPKQFDYYLLSATKYDSIPRTVIEWADTFNLNIVINAGMYELSKKLQSKGYLKSHGHYNNPNVHPTYNATIAFNPIDTNNNTCFNILDTKCVSWEKIDKEYHCCAQGMRMLDCDGQPLSWDKKKQSCSMLIAAKGTDGFVYFIFTRSPYTHSQMIQFMLSFPFKLTNAIYMEGGPETSLYIRVGETIIEKVGSYVSNTYPTDDNKTYWPLPNVIGLKLKK